jgi:subtilisin family serine protease
MKKTILLILVVVLTLGLAAEVAKADFTFDTPTNLGPTTYGLAMDRTPYDYTVTAGNEQLRFVRRPELGYVVKAEEKETAIEALYGMLRKSGATDIKPVRGLVRRGISVVHSERSANDNKKTIRMLRALKQIRYAAPLFSSNGETVAIIPEMVVRVRTKTDGQRLKKLCRKMNLTIKKKMAFTEVEYLIEVLGGDADTVFAALEQVNQISFIEWAAPNIALKPRLHGQAIPNDPDFAAWQWHLDNTGQLGGTPDVDINAPEAWEITTGDPNIIVAVLDTGVDTKHPDLVNNLVPGYDFRDDDNDPSPAPTNNTHGTACAGLVAAQGNNGIGITGVTWNCKIMPIRTSTSSYVTADVAAVAFRWAASNGADVLTCSWSSSEEPIFNSAIVDVTKPGGIGRNGKGCVVLAAAGNGNGPLDYPARHPDVIAVGATDNKDQRKSYSNYGPELEIVAPGGGLPGDNVWVWTTDITGSAGYRQGDYTPFGGTSSACPVAAGIAALVLSVEPELTSEEVRHFLTRSAKDLGDPGRDGYYGWGRVDARAALDMVLTKRSDLNNNWRVDFEDLLILIEFWGTTESSADIAPATKHDGIVDEQDLELLMQYWQTESPELGLIVNWKLDETEGIIAQDNAGKNDAYIIGDPIWLPDGGMVDGALQFDGIDDYVSSIHVLNPEYGKFSVFVWIKGGAPGQVIISQMDGANWLLADSFEGNLTTELKSAGRGGSPLFSQTVITDGEWHRIGVVWDGLYRILYVDGVAVAQDTQDGLGSSEGDLYIGTDKGMESGTYFSGLIDDVRIYNRAIIP